jgi:hypothetical protein
VPLRLLYRTNALETTVARRVATSELRFIMMIYESIPNQLEDTVLRV